MRIPKASDNRVFFWLSVLAILGVAEILIRSRFISPAGYAAPSEIPGAIVYLFTNRGFLQDISATALRSLASTLLGFPLGVLLAVALLSLGKAQTSGELSLDFVRSIPITTLIPLFIAIYGVGDRSKIAIGAFSALLVTSITVWIDIKQGLERFRILLHLYKPSYIKRMILVVLPYSLPAMVTALKLASSSALVLVIVSEMFIGTRNGIGKVINDMTYSDNRPAQYAAIICAGILGYALNVLFDRLRRQVLLQFDLGPDYTTV